MTCCSPMCMSAGQGQFMMHAIARVFRNSPLHQAISRGDTVLPTYYLIHQRKLLYWNKLSTSDNSVLFTLSRSVSQRFVAVGYMYGLSSIHVSRQTIKQAVCGTFSSTVEYVLLVICLCTGFFTL